MHFLNYPLELELKEAGQVFAQWCDLVGLRWRPAWNRVVLHKLGDVFVKKTVVCNTMEGKTEDSEK